MVRRELVSSRQQARALIEAGRVTVAGAPTRKPARLVDPAEAVAVAGEAPRFVSRAGFKLDAALDRFAVPVAGERVIDCGASTGGFTDCLLQRGAARVVAVDVGRGQLHQSLITDDRVDSRERTNVRFIEPGDLGGAASLVVADLSFISLRTVLPALVGLATPAGSLIVLVKPQFEVGRHEASKGRGVIRDPQLWLDALRATRSAALDAGAVMMEVMVSPITGAEGNVEFLAHLVVADGPDAEPVDDETLQAVVDHAHEGQL